MRRTALLLLAVPLAAGCVAEAKKPAKAAATQSGIDETALDPTVDPCDDFYAYACGNWLKRTEIPADRPGWFRSFNEIDERNQTELKNLLEALAKRKSGAKDEDPYSDKLAAYYGACMDEAKIEASAAADLAELLAPIDKIANVDQLAVEVARQHVGIGGPLFGFDSQQDFKDANLMIGVADQGGLALPDRDYYLKDEPRMKELRAKYEAHVARMLELAGAPAAQAKAQAATVMKIETELAKASLSRVERRDPKKIYHRLELGGLEKIAPAFPWKRYLASIGHPDVRQINVTSPAFFTAMNGLLGKVPLADWKVYLRWHLVHGAAMSLSQPFVDETFAFFGKTLQGTDKLLPRWKRCVQAVDHAMGEALARPFIRKTFGEEGKATTLAMVKAIEAAMEKNLSTLAWMDDATRKAAFEKLHAIRNKIGFPDQWRNYDSLEVSRDSYVKNLERANQFEVHRRLSKIGKPVDRNEWFMSPPTVNAYYEPSLNEMVFPAGILQPPFFNRKAHAAVNYGAIGMVMGHELTHGFDDEGRQFDAKGNLSEWWSPKVNTEFEKRAQCVADQYEGYTVLDNVHLNGKLTLGENIADLGGIKLAYAAYAASRKAPAKVGKFTDDQLFFLGVAQAWCGKRRDEDTRRRVVVDPHSPPEYRVNGPLSNLPEFADAFHCKPEQKMVRQQNQCVVW